MVPKPLRRWSGAAGVLHIKGSPLPNTPLSPAAIAIDAQLAPGDRSPTLHRFVNAVRRLSMPA